MVIAPFLVLLTSMLLFAALFVAAHHLSKRFVQVYRDFSVEEQGDWCSRVNSTIHAFTIVPLILYAISQQEYDHDLLPLRSPAIAKACFSFSCGYFLFDLYVLVHWKVPYWKVFAIHHIVACLPYLIYNFYPGCGMDLYLLTLFLLVEIAVVPLNFTTFVEQLGFGRSRMHSILFYLTYVCWFLARVVLPLYIMYVMWVYLLFPIGLLSSSVVCVLPAAICGHMIAAFCIGIFVFVWTPDMLAKWREPVSHLEEYQDYKLTLRQSMTPRSSPLISKTPGSRSSMSYGSVSLGHTEP